MSNTENNSKIKISVIEWLESIVIALVCVMILYTFFFRTATVYGPSMDTTLATGDMLIVQCSFNTAQPGDIVVIDSYIEFGKPLVKRVVAKGGDVVDIDNNTNTVFVNGIALDEPYISSQTTSRDGGTQFPLTVDEGKIFVMGDNRAISKDSRSIDVGLIDERDVLGVVIFRTMPFNKIGVIE